MQKTTIVTMLFDLKNLKDASPATRPLDFYLERCAPILRLPYPMVIFCDEVTQPFLKTIRDTEFTDSLSLTQYVVQRLETYDYYRYSWDIIQENREKRGNPTDTRNTASYFLMGMFKPLALWIAHQRNDFHSSHYAWIDIGCSHICRNVSTYAVDMIEHPHPKIAVCYIHYRSHDELISMEEYMKYGGPCGIASTAYTMPASHVISFYTLMFQIFYEKLFRGVGHTDETVMVYAYDRNPELFTLFYGDYGSIFVNYLTIKEDIPNIVHFFIGEVQKKGRMDLARLSAQKLLNSESDDIDKYRTYLWSIIGTQVPILGGFTGTWVPISDISDTFFHIK